MPGVSGGLLCDASLRRSLLGAGVLRAAGCDADLRTPGGRRSGPPAIRGDAQVADSDVGRDVARTEAWRVTGGGAKGTGSQSPPSLLRTAPYLPSRKWSKIMTHSSPRRKRHGPSTSEGVTGPVGAEYGPPGVSNVVTLMSLWAVSGSLVPRSSLKAMRNPPSASSCTVASMTECPGSKKTAGSENFLKSSVVQCQMRWSWLTYSKLRPSAVLPASTTDDQMRWYSPVARSRKNSGAQAL